MNTITWTCAAMCMHERAKCASFMLLVRSDLGVAANVAKTELQKVQTESSQTVVEPVRKYLRLLEKV